MARVQIRFYEELNDFLSPALRKTDITHEFERRTSVKDMIESFGVPHTEVDIILVNGHSVDFSRIVQDGDRISVYPVFESLDVSPLVRLRPEPLRTRNSFSIPTSGDWRATCACSALTACMRMTSRMRRWQASPANSSARC